MKLLCGLFSEMKFCSNPKVEIRPILPTPPFPLKVIVFTNHLIYQSTDQRSTQLIQSWGKLTYEQITIITVRLRQCFFILPMHSFCGIIHYQRGILYILLLAENLKWLRIFRALSFICYMGSTYR